MSRSLDPERPRNYIQERKNKKKIDFISEIFVATERDRQRVQEKNSSAKTTRYTR